MLLSAFYIISSRGDVLLYEKYRDDIPEEHLNYIVSAVAKSKPGVGTACIKHKEVQGYSIKREKVTYLVITRKEISSIIILQFLESFYSLVRNFCGGATEDYIVKNLVLIHELMTECVDNGFIRSTNTELVWHNIYSNPVSPHTHKKCETRKPGPVVKSAEVFVDVIEKLIVHFSKQHAVKIFHLNGVIQLKSFIACNHHVIISLEDSSKAEGLHKSALFDIYQFDNCVDSKSFEEHRSFVIHPFQGEVKAMIYSIESPILLPLRLTAHMQESDQNRDCDLTLHLSSNLPSNTEALNLSLHIPVSSCTRNIMQQFSMYENDAEFLSKERKILWKLKKLPGQGEVIAKFKLIDAIHFPANRLEMGPVSLEFEASNISCSGMKIRNIKAEDPSGKVIPIQKWVRYATLAQSYVFEI
ncbi:AP-4 complex subunit mu-1-like isoform X2 [Stegodyphus dumicola]|uniref:AP-4 complex subunit mu-1-like isoform X2 n=1 Tax=Stegodyphus dumicola TaxID=202533 RepID=UPI0015B2ADB5|nr:AP-4 complex subunit mu-1-like isoform X2 [Stegodyphus dumicola]